LESASGYEVAEWVLELEEAGSVWDSAGNLGISRW